MSNQPAADPTVPTRSEPSLLQLIREYTTAGIAIAIVLGTIIITGLAFTTIANSTNFTNAKEILNLVFPALTFVLGHYFNKASTEGRAESAEATAKTASMTANQAVAERKEAQLEAEAASVEADALKGSLKEVTALAEDMISTVENEPGFSPAMATPGTLGADEETTRRKTSWEKNSRDLRLAIAQAHRMLED